jgi:hypothetical protein
MVVSRETRKWLEGRLASLKKPITLTVFTQEHEDLACRANRELAETLAELSPRVMVEISQFAVDKSEQRKYAVEAIPALVVSSKDGTRARFYGGVSGFGLETLATALESASVGPRLSEVTCDWLGDLTKDVKLDVFASSGTLIAPEAASLVARFGLASPWVFASIYKLPECPHLAVRHQIKELPTILINGKLAAETALPESRFLEILKGSEA